jgi:DNA-directed RNA polymerase subunit RPC12/RpoP
MKIHCPECHSDAIYRYGLTPGKKQRYICLLCERQFVAHPQNIHFTNKPLCPECEKPMHSYMKHPDYIRFRCSDYPHCKTYLKVHEAEFELTSSEMVSETFNLEVFFSKIRGKPTWEVLHLTHVEVTASELLLIKSISMPNSQRNRIENYVEVLSDFMQFMRSSIKIPSAVKGSNPLFWGYWSSIENKNGL